MLDHSTHKNILSRDYFQTNEQWHAHMDDLEKACAKFYDEYPNRVSALSDEELLQALRRHISIEDSVAGVVHHADILEREYPHQYSSFLQEAWEAISVRTRPTKNFSAELKSLEIDRLKELLAKESFEDFHPLVKRFTIPAHRQQPYFSKETAHVIVNKCKRGEATDDPHTNEFRETMVHKILLSAAYKYFTADGHAHDASFVSSTEIQALRDVLQESKPLFALFNSNLIFLMKQNIYPTQDILTPFVVPWEKAENTILKAYKSFSPKLGGIAEKLISKNAIHLIPANGQTGKTIQACRCFSPEMFLTYNGSWSDVREAAHEIGHMTQSVMRNGNARIQGMHTPFVDETCAIFGERIFWEFAKKEADGTGVALMDTCDSLGSVMRFAIIDEFQQNAADLCQNGKFTASSLDQAWQHRRESYLGFSEEIVGKTDWREDVHVLSSPFTALSYAYGQLVSACFWKEHEANPYKFEQRYSSFLEGTSKAAPRDLLRAFGFNTESKDFWRSALDFMFDDYNHAIRSGTENSGYSRQKMLKNVFE